MGLSRVARIETPERGEKSPRAEDRRVSRWLLGALALGLALGLADSAAAAEAIGFPAFDIETRCRDLARYAFAATLGQADLGEEEAACKYRESTLRDLARSAWATAPETVRTQCVELAERKYSALARCLDPAVPGRVPR